MKQAGRTDLMRLRRSHHVPIAVENKLILIRDQAPLHKGNLKLPNGYHFEDFIESLNRRVFFWPGNSAGPISYGLRHFERYREERPAVLRIDYKSLILANPAAVPQFCAYNSGSPRCSYGEKSPRGLNTFLSAINFSGTPSQVVEVTFESKIVLPADTMVNGDPRGPWRVLMGRNVRKMTSNLNA